jgi:putative SOS response-associated peptidase YedK
VLRYDAEGFSLEGSRWGLIPKWMWKRHEQEAASSASKEAGFVNARVETAAEKASFRDAFAKRRCAVPVSGFYEWKKSSKQGDGKQPHFIQMGAGAPAGYKQGGLFFMAGIYEPWGAAPGKGSQPKSSFSILTTNPNAILRGIHDRMPLILSPSQLLSWLGWPTAQSAVEDSAIREPCPSSWLEAYAVSTRVNSPDNDDSLLIQPLQESLALS